MAGGKRFSRMKLFVLVMLAVMTMTGCGGSSSSPVVSVEDTPAQEDIVPQTETPASFDLVRGIVTLNNGVNMPILGIGTYALSSTQAENSVYWALKAGFRLIDTARIYGNEDGVGRGIRRAFSEGIVSRDEIFVTTKMWTSDYSDGESAINASLQRLELDYIGLSNYYTPEDFDRLAEAVTVPPAVLQNETHPYHQSSLMKEHIAQYGTVLESWYPLGGRGHTQELFSDPVISAIASAHNKTSAQIVIRWHLQAGNIAIPGSSNEQHIIENFGIWDFSLTDDEMRQIAALNQDRRNSTY